MSTSDLEDALFVGCDDAALEDVDGLAALLSSEDELELELESRRFFFFLLFLLKLKKVIEVIEIFLKMVRKDKK